MTGPLTPTVLIRLIAAVIVLKGAGWDLPMIYVPESACEKQSADKKTRTTNSIFFITDVKWLGKMETGIFAIQLFRSQPLSVMCQKNNSGAGEAQQW